MVEIPLKRNCFSFWKQSCVLYSIDNAHSTKEPKCVFVLYVMYYKSYHLLLFNTCFCELPTSFTAQTKIFSTLFFYWQKKLFIFWGRKRAINWPYSGGQVKHGQHRHITHKKVRTYIGRQTAPTCIWQKNPPSGNFGYFLRVLTFFTSAVSERSYYGKLQHDTCHFSWG